MVFGAGAYFLDVPRFYLHGVLFGSAIPILIWPDLRWGVDVQGRMVLGILGSVIIGVGLRKLSQFVEHASRPDSNTGLHLVRASRREVPGFMEIPMVFFVAETGLGPDTVTQAAPDAVARDHSGRMPLTSITRQIGSAVARAIEWNMVTQGLLATDLNGIHSNTVLRDIPGAVMQPEEWQSLSKQSHRVEDGAETQLAEIRNELEERDSEAMGVCSAGKLLEPWLPRSVEAGTVRSPAESLGIDPSIVIVAEHTGIGLGMMRPDLGFRSIALGNASPERRECRVPNVRHASAPFSTGVQEGLRHHGWLPEQSTCNGTGTSTTKGWSDDQH